MASFRLFGSLLALGTACCVLIVCAYFNGQSKPLRRKLSSVVSAGAAMRRGVIEALSVTDGGKRETPSQPPSTLGRSPSGAAGEVPPGKQLESSRAAATRGSERESGSLGGRRPNAAYHRRKGSTAASFDERVYDVLASNGVTSVRALRRLDAARLTSLTSQLGVSDDVVIRVYSMMYAFKGNFHRKEYAFVAEPADCASDFAGAVMFVFSLPGARAERNAIRSTWARELLTLRGSFFRVLFIMGLTDDVTSAAAAASSLEDERREFGDLLVADFEEDYHNLTLKSLLTMRWTSRHCAGAKLLVKVDADVQVVAPNFASALLDVCAPARRSILGWVSSYDPVHRSPDSKWYVPPAIYAGDMYPSFAHGPCYVVTTDLLGDLLMTANKLDYLHLEDVFLSAVCVQHIADATLVNLPDFITWNCSNRRTAVYHDVNC